MRVLNLDLKYLLLDDERSLPDALRSLASFLDDHQQNLDKPGISHGFSNHTFLWNCKLGSRVTGKASIHELRNQGRWIRIDSDISDTFLVR